MLFRSKFGANAAWLRLNAMLYNLLSAYKRVGLPEEFHTARHCCPVKPGVPARNGMILNGVLSI